MHRLARANCCPSKVRADMPTLKFTPPSGPFDQPATNRAREGPHARIFHCSGHCLGWKYLTPLASAPGSPRILKDRSVVTGDPAFYPKSAAPSKTWRSVTIATEHLTQFEKVLEL